MDVMEVCRCNQQFVVWCEKTNQEMARTFMCMFCDAPEDLYHGRRQSTSGIQLCSMDWGWGARPCLSHLWSWYLEILGVQFAGVGGSL